MSKRLPVVGSTAATTAFDSARIDGPNATHLFIDGNGKITRDNGTLAAPRPNAFSLVQVETCPGSTEACRSACYVHNLETHQGAIHDLYKHNTVEIRRILASDELASEWVMLMAGWIREHAAGGFRWHVSGDVFSPEYAEWIADVCAEAPEVPFWIYTRSFGDAYLRPLVAQSVGAGGNLAVNLSCDRDNYIQAFAASVRHRTPKFEDGVYAGNEWLRLCYLTLDGTVPTDLPEGSVIFPDYNLRPRQFATLAESPWWGTLTPAQRAMVCPVDAHGKSEKNRCGPCTRCLT